jgi:deoxyguanosine kinase
MIHNYLVIEGNIGAGKTSLSQKIAKDFNGNLLLEQFDENPFLPKFYENKEKYAFHVELAFLADRYAQLKKAMASPDLFKSFFVADYFIHKCKIFASATLKDDEMVLFNNLYQIIIDALPKPDLVVYLFNNTETLKSNIKKRGRVYESAIDENYLLQIQESYFNFFKQSINFPILIIDTSEIDFVNHQNHYQKLIEIINIKYDVGIHRHDLKK